MLGSSSGQWSQVRKVTASRLTAVMSWNGSEEEAVNIKKTTGGELKKVPGLRGTGKIMYKQVWVTTMQRTPGPQLRAARFQTEAPKIFPTTVVRLNVDKRSVSEQRWTAIVQRPARWPRNGASGISALRS